MAHRSFRISFVSIAAVLSITAAFSASGDETTNRLAANKLASNRLAANRLGANRLAANKLAANKLAANKLASNRLGANRLGANRLAANEANPGTADLLETAEGRELFSYVVSCALPEAIAIEADVPGAPDSTPPETTYTCADGHCVFAGALGLAEHWLDRPLDPKGQRWVSACLLARVNRYGIAQQISLRGAAPSLAVDAGEAQAYPVEEGAFFGNVFAGGQGEMDWHACRGEGQAAGEGGGLELRDCTEEDPDNPGYTYCGFEYAGDCDQFSDAPSPHACADFDPEDGSYAKCHAEAGDGQWPGLPPYREVITVYVAE
jgi:hypothetical protein